MRIILEKNKKIAVLASIHKYMYKVEQTVAYIISTLTCLSFFIVLYPDRKRKKKKYAF